MFLQFYDNSFTLTYCLKKNYDPKTKVATPGRLIDHLHNTPNFSLRDLEILVLDEADRMLDEFFASQMKEILAQTGNERQAGFSIFAITSRILKILVEHI